MNLNRLQVLAQADAHSASMCWNFLLCVLAVVLTGAAVIAALYLIRRALDVLPQLTAAVLQVLATALPLYRRVDAALRADARRKYLQSSATARPQRRRAA